MKKATIAAVIALSAVTAVPVQAVSIIPLKNTLEYFITEGAFDMKEQAHITSNGSDYTIHASKDNANEVLVMEDTWSPIAIFTSLITVDKAQQAAEDFAVKSGINASFEVGSLYYHSGSYGYSFTVVPAQ